MTALPSDNYVFVSYSHRDTDRVKSEIALLSAKVSVWYDDAIVPGARWHEELASAIKHCSVFLFYITPDAVASEHCVRELSFAMEEARPILAVQLEETKLSDGLRFSLNHIQALKKHLLTPEIYEQRLTEQIQNFLEGKKLVRVSNLPRSRPSVAVLPFHNLSNDPEQTYFAEGISEDLITYLTSEMDFPVIDRNSAFRYRSRDVDYRQVYRELGTRYVVTGSVRKSGEKIRLNISLVDCEQSVEIWSSRFDRKLVDIFELQDELASTILNHIYPEMIQSETRRVNSITTDLGAWDWMLKGFFHEQRMNPEDNDRARVCFLNALELDDSLLRANLGLVLTCYMDNQYYNTSDRATNLAMSELASQRCLRSHPDNAMTYIPLGMVAQMKRNTEAAASAYRRAIELNDNLLYGHCCLAALLIYAGQPDEGLAEHQRAMEISPRDPYLWGWHLDMGIAYMNKRQFDVAMMHIGRSMDMRTDWANTWLFTASCLRHLGTGEESGEALHRALELYGLDLEKISLGLRLALAPQLYEIVIEGLNNSTGSVP
jgi:adenylate cyclase